MGKRFSKDGDWQFSKDDKKFEQDLHKHLYMDSCTECIYQHYQQHNGSVISKRVSCPNSKCQDGHIPRANAPPFPAGSSSQKDASPPSNTEVRDPDTEEWETDEWEVENPAPTRNASQNAKTPPVPKPDAGKYIAFRGKASETRRREGLLFRNRHLK